MLNPLVRSLTVQGTTRTAICYAAYGEWNDELEWEFLRLVAHVSRSPLMTNYDVVLLWETMDGSDAVAYPPTASPALMRLMADNARVRLFHATVDEASLAFPTQAFQHGFYYNPEVALLLFLKHSAVQYNFYWLVESDVRWTVRNIHHHLLLCTPPVRGQRGAGAEPPRPRPGTIVIPVLLCF